MTDAVENLLIELEHFSISNDQSTSVRTQRMLNITRDTGEFLSVLVQATSARRILEIGTSNGYSTLWLARAADVTDGMVDTIELSDYKLELARQNFERSGLKHRIVQHAGDAGEHLRTEKTAGLDLIFLDSERRAYAGWWPELKRILRPGGLLIVDNAQSHAEQMAPFRALVEADEDFTTCLVPVGKGEFLATRRP
ncbi:putative O-methyltransferase YrrM [Pseudomonas duriflava]|uniref:Putative O-methyltransferase YrrM n=1 Tax=Pseudomonas duriflava TaxID=459528 RepID=A0A562QF82_9PSED|nr:class I SAM-dependent methyltransferase [Pseudomonas duriflava]TWI54830.1 putative O-methyltransferase YrrM [Pseudomonas duriflava]